MKSTTAVFTVVSLFTLTTAVSQAQQRHVPQYEHLKGLEPFIGQWEGKFDPPGDVPIGTVHLSGTWLGSKSYVYFKVTFVPDNTDIVINATNVFVGFSGATQATHAWHLGIMSQANTDATITKDKLVMEGGQGLTIQGKPQSRTTTYQLRPADEMVVTNTNIRLDGKDLPDEDVLVLKRVKASDSQ